MKTAAAMLLALGLLASSRTGNCQENPKPVEGRSWYGGQIILADTLAYATILGGLASNNYPVALIGLGGYLVAPPVIHGLHHQPKGVARVAFRLLLPLAGYSLGSGLASCSGEDRGFCKFIHGALGLGVGMIAASIVDSALAWESVTAPQPVPPPTSAAPKAHRLVSLSSLGVVPTPNGASLVLGGQF